MFELPANIDLSDISASSQGPSGMVWPCYLKSSPDGGGKFNLSFVPREPGEHMMSIKCKGKHLPKSPFRLIVFEGQTNYNNIFKVDTQNAGIGDINSSVKYICEVNDTRIVAYVPRKPGVYNDNLKFYNNQIEGSPFTVNIADEGGIRQRESIRRECDAVPVTEIGSKCKFTFKMAGKNSLYFATCVTSPSNVTEGAEIQEVDDGVYSVHFVPKELGVHTISVRYKKIHISGSPFLFTAGSLRDFGSHLVKATGFGLKRGVVDQTSEFSVWAREAGAGSLAISVEGPSKAEIKFKNRNNGSSDVVYKVTQSGQYSIDVTFNDRHIPNSPFKVSILSDIDANKPEVEQFPEGIVQIFSICQFMVRHNGAKGKFDAIIITPSGIQDRVIIDVIDAALYSVSFFPDECGIYDIIIFLNGIHIPDSPFKIKVDRYGTDSASVYAIGDGLYEVKTGHKADFIINTCHVGVGTLEVTISGPSKVAMDCTEVEEGFKVHYTPLLPGEHYVTVKYNKEHTLGSPFRVNCTGDKLADESVQKKSTIILDTVMRYPKGGKYADINKLIEGHVPEEAGNNNS